MSNNELVKQLKRIKGLEAGGQPQGSWVSGNRDILMSQIKPQSIATREQSVSTFKTYLNYFSSILKNGVLKPMAAFAVVVITMLGYTAMSSIASASLPGDAMYPIKTATEQVQLALTFPEDQKVALQMDFIGRRANEIQTLAKQPDQNPVTQAQKVSQTAKKISEDVKTVKEGLNKISAASDNDSTIQLAKTIDTKTLEVGQALATAQTDLPADVKVNVAKEMKDAIKTNDDAGTSALNVIVDNFKKGDSKISDKEMTSRVADHIKNVEDNIKVANSEAQTLLNAPQVSNITTTTVVTILNGVVDSSLVSSTSSTSSATSTLQAIAEKPQQAQDIIDQAKSSLVKGDFGTALVQIQESKNIVTNVTAGVQAVSGAIQADINASSTGATSTASTTVKSSTIQVLLK